MFFSKLTELKKLDMTINQLAQIPNISSLKKLQEINFKRI